MALYMDLVVDEANYVLENSEVELRLRIVHSMRMLDGSYTEPGTDLGDILDQATEYSGTGKPEFDTEQAMRYTEKADVFVVISGSTAGNQCGIAWLKTSDSFPSSYAVSVSALDCLSGYGTMIHELGHNLGCTHDVSASTPDSGYKSYSHGYCWDRAVASSCDGTCYRSTMAYSSCTTPLGCSSCDKYDIFSNPSVLVEGSPVGTASLNNARSLNESRSVAITMQDSSVEGGMVFSVEPNHISVDTTCFEVTLTGWHIGGGDDISAVTLAGVSSVLITSQSKHHVTLNVFVTGAVAETGDAVIISSGFTTTLIDGFTFDSSTSVVLVEDFETKLDIFYQGDESVGWHFLDGSCPTGTGEVCQYNGPATGDGMFALAKGDGSGRDALFESEFSSENCVDTVTEISVKYYAYSVSSCFSSNFIQLRVQYSPGGGWTSVASTSSKQSSNSQSWKTLSTSGFNNVVYGVQVFTKTSSSYPYCEVAVDDISVAFTSVCDCATSSPTITFAPTGTPSSSAPTVVPDDDDSLLSSQLLIPVAAAAVVFICIMACFCWCDKWRAGRRARKAAYAASQHREQQLASY